ncbi:hypothetical protein [Chitinophaga rhizophila]|nr:hypothetical protein [Chitinophaga rhizophila]
MTAAVYLLLPVYDHHDKYWQGSCLMRMIIHSKGGCKRGNMA